MIDNSISDETQPVQDPDSENQVKVYANISSLANEGGNPEVGDEVTLTVVGKVDSVDGDVVCVVPETVNGEPAPQAPDSDDESPTSERDALYANAQKLDSSSD